MNVLIVDDSKIVRRVLTNTVDRYFSAPTWTNGCKIFEAEDGLVAMDQMKKQEIDIMLLDWNMPNMNGEEVVDAVRTNKNGIKLVKCPIRLQAKFIRLLCIPVYQKLLALQKILAYHHQFPSHR